MNRSFNPVTVIYQSEKTATDKKKKDLDSAGLEGRSSHSIPSGTLLLFTFMSAFWPLAALISNKTEWKSRKTGHAPLKQLLYSPQQQSLYMLICLQYLWSTCWWRPVLSNVLLLGHARIPGFLGLAACRNWSTRRAEAQTTPLKMLQRLRLSY